jgi:hypothetical protein
MLAFQLRAAIEAAPRERLSELSSALWKGFAAGAVSETEAEEMSLLIEARKATGAPHSPAGGFQRGRATIIPPARKPQRPPVRSAAIERRRRWAAAGRMPPKLAAHFTLGEQAVLAVIALEVTKRNVCSLAIDAIAALAGVSESTVKRALKQARALGLLTIQERRLSRYRNDTNIVHVISREWLSWLELRRSGGGVQPRTGTSTKALEGHRKRPAEPVKKAFGRVKAEPIRRLENRNG